MAIDLKKIFSTSLILVGIYYILVSFNIITSKIIWIAGYTPKNYEVFFVGLIVIILAVILDNDLRRQVKNVIGR